MAKKRASAPPEHIDIMESALAAPAEEAPEPSDLALIRRASKESLIRLAPKAVTRLEEMLDCDDAKSVVSAASHILDRVGITKESGGVDLHIARDALPPEVTAALVAGLGALALGSQKRPK